MDHRHAQQARAAAVILWLTREDEALAWHVPAMQRALAAANLPALVLPAASWRADDGALERIATFCREVHPMTPLAGTRVLALADMASRPLGRFLASLGADVQPVRADAADLHAAIAAADFLLDPWGLDVLADRGLPRERIESLNPALVQVSVSAFGSGNARSRWQGAELVASAMGGALRLTGEPDRAPVKEALDACTFHAEMAAAAGAMAAWFARGAHGKGQHVDVSIQEVAFSRNVNGALVWHFDRRKLHRVGGALNYGRVTVRCIWPLADGWCFHTLMTGRFGAPANQALSEWMDEAGVDNPLRGVDWLRYNRSTLDPATRATWEDAIAAFFKSRTRADIRGEGRRRGINACVIESPAEVLADPHLEARGFWAQRDGQREPARFARIVGGADAAAAPPPSPRDRATAAADRWPACASWISPGRWWVRSPPRSWATWAPTSSRWKRARVPACRGSTCRWPPRAPMTSTTSPGSRT